MEHLHGISGKNRELLSDLHHHKNGPFSVKEAADVFKMSVDKTRLFLGYLNSRKWVSRIRPGIYIAVPMGLTFLDSYIGDLWEAADKMFGPCYIGGWSAGEYWHFTDQIFNDIAVFTTRKIREKEYRIKSHNFFRYILKHISEDKMFGLVKGGIGREFRVNVSDPERTIVDFLNDPRVGGGIRHVALMIYEYFSESERKRDDDTLIKYIKQFGNRAIFKRLAYILNFYKPELEVDISNIYETCLENISKGYSYLTAEKSVEDTKIIKKYNLIVNASLNTFAQEKGLPKE